MIIIDQILNFVKKVTRGGTSGGQLTDVSRSPLTQRQNVAGDGQEYNPGWKLPTAADTLPSEQANSFMGPQDPVTPVVARDVAGRAFDFPLGVNRQYEPRQAEKVTFDTLKQLADNCEIVRLAIETRKDQMSRLEYNIVPRDDDVKIDDNPGFADRIETLEAFFRLPDGDNDWHTWLRMLLEQLMVIDAPTIFPKISNGGELLALEVVDGAMIKLVIDEWGRTPDAPYPAYQQIIKGIPAVNFTKDELIYRPRNKRVDRLYGFSQVEQIITMVNIAIRRELWQLNYFSEGTDPQGFLEVPAGFTPDQIAAFQKYWDSLLTDNLATRRKIKMVGPGAKYTAVKEAVLTDGFDEWIARMVCFAFSLPPTAFTKQVNRATAESSAEVAEEEGLHPLMLWVETTMNYIIVKYFNIDDLVFRWNTDTPLDAKTKAEVDKIYLSTGVVSVDEVREKIGLEPIGMDEPVFIAGQTIMLATDVAAGKYGPEAQAQMQNDAADAQSQRNIAEAKVAPAPVIAPNKGKPNDSTK